MLHRLQITRITSSLNLLFCLNHFFLHNFYAFFRFFLHFEIYLRTVQLLILASVIHIFFLSSYILSFHLNHFVCHSKVFFLSFTT